MSNTSDMYDTVFSLIEEELYQRLNPESYADLNNDPQFGGQSMQSNYETIGKFDIIRYSHNIPLNVAIKGTLARQKLFNSIH